MVITQTVVADDVIKKHVIEKLYWNLREDISTIKVDVLGGVVVLRGTIPRNSAVESAVAIVWNIVGVKGFINLLTVNQ